MKPNEYVELAIRTESNDFDEIRKRLLLITTIRLDHAADGLVTEAGEFKDALKKYKFYGKDFDVVNLVEELGDLMWYIAIACDATGTSLETIMERNIAKLHARYGDKFNESSAISRDLEVERNLLEGNVDDIEKSLIRTSILDFLLDHLMISEFQYNQIKRLTSEDFTVWLKT